jgi:chemotaxis methyl-accepting protein methylase
MTDPLPAGLDLILCRYLAFTYYHGERRRLAGRRLWQALRPGGALMIGRKEGLGPAGDLFTPWPEAPGVFRKQPVDAATPMA